MAYMDRTLGGRVAARDNERSAQDATREALILVIEDQFELSNAFRGICDCLNIVVERMPSSDDLASALRHRRPMAVVAEMDAAGQDGCHVLMTVAAHEPDLPVCSLRDPTPHFSEPSMQWRRSGSSHPLSSGLDCLVSGRWSISCFALAVRADACG